MLQSMKEILDATLAHENLPFDMWFDTNHKYLVSEQAK
jgi:hypothetical protein